MFNSRLNIYKTNAIKYDFKIIAIAEPGLHFLLSAQLDKKTQYKDAALHSQFYSEPKTTPKTKAGFKKEFMHLKDVKA